LAHKNEKHPGWGALVGMSVDKKDAALFFIVFVFLFDVIVPIKID
jgi:hypothetical protein